MLLISILKASFRMEFYILKDVSILGVCSCKKLVIILIDPAFRFAYLFFFLGMAVLYLFCLGSLSFFYHWIDICHQTEKVSTTIYFRP